MAKLSSQERNKRRSSCALGCALSSLFCGGFIMIVVGAVYLARSVEDKRGDLISEYKRSLDRWNGGIAAAWSAHSTDPNYFAASISVQGLNTSVALPLDGSTLERFPIEVAGDVPVLNDPERYRRWAVPVSYVYSDSPAALSAAAQFDMQEDGMYASSSLPFVWRRVYDKTCLESSKTGCRTYGCEYGGLFSNDQCTLWFVPEEVCVAVDGNGVVTGGCAVFSETDRNAMGKAYAYDVIAHRRQASPPSGAQSASLVLTVRSDSDPWVVAMRATNGAMAFGDTAESLRSTGIGVLVAGLVMTALIGWLVHSCVTSCRYCCCRCCRPSPVLISGDPQKGYAGPMQVQGAVAGAPALAPVGFIAASSASAEAAAGPYQQYMQPTPQGMQMVPQQQYQYVAQQQPMYAQQPQQQAYAYASAPPAVYYSNPQAPQQQY